MSQVYLNGAFLPASGAKVSVMDRGFLFGDGVYEVIPSYGGHFLGLGPHLERLDASLQAIGMGNPLGRDQWRSVLRRLIGPAPAADQYCYLQITRGAPDARDHLCPAGVEPTVLAMAKPIKPRPAEVAEQGVSCVIRPDIRWGRCDIKSVSLLAAVMMRGEAESAGAMEAIMQRDGLITEGSSTNVLVVSGGEIATPPRSAKILSGITRGLVLGLARDAALPCREREVTEDELRQADEVWITSSTREALPVTRIDGQAVGTGVPGALWRQVNGLYQSYKSMIRAGDAEDA